MFGGEGAEYYSWLKYATRAGINPDAPPGANPGFDPVALAEAARKIAEAAAAAAAGGGGGGGGGDGGSGSEQSAQAPAATAAAAEAAAPMTAPAAPKPVVTQAGSWQAVKDATGRTYYWNKETNATTWDAPPGF